MKKQWIVFFVLSLLCVACSTQSNAPGASNIQVVNAAASSSPTSSPASTPTAQATAQATTQPTRPPTAKPPTAKPTVKPTPKPKPTATPFPYHICTFASCPNPWGYHLQAGINGSGVQSAPSGFCSWFLCAANFANTGGPGGMIVACNDNAMDWTQDFNANRCGNDAGIRGYLTS